MKKLILVLVGLILVAGFGGIVFVRHTVHKQAKGELLNSWEYALRHMLYWTIYSEVTTQQIEKDLAQQGELAWQSKRKQSYAKYKPCLINGHDCWNVVELLDKTKVIYPTEIDANGRNWGRLISSTPPHYENPALKEMGIEIIKAGAFYDGGSRLYQFSNGIQIYFNEYAGNPNPERGFTTITWTNGQQFKFNERGYLVSYTPANQQAQ